MVKHITKHPGKLIKLLLCCFFWGLNNDVGVDLALVSAGRELVVVALEAKLREHRGHHPVGNGLGCV